MSAFTVKIKIDFRGVILFKAARRLETLDMFSTSLNNERSGDEDRSSSFKKILVALARALNEFHISIPSEPYESCSPFEK